MWKICVDLQIKDRGGEVLDKVDLEEATEEAQAGVYLIFKNSINQQTNFKKKQKVFLGLGGVMAQRVTATKAYSLGLTPGPT